MQPEVGAVLEGKVSGVTKFGAFVNLPGDKSGLVHISEIANTFVSDVAQYVSVGQTVKVKVIGINGDKINLSIKRAEESKEAPRRRAPQQRSEQQSRPPKQPQQPSGQVAAPTEDQAFEDKLKQFMKDSDSRIADNRMYADRGRSRRKPKISRKAQPTGARSFAGADFRSGKAKLAENTVVLSRALTQHGRKSARQNR